MKEKGIKILFSIFLFASILMPFSVSAEAVGGSSPIIGVNITYIGYDGEVVPYQTTVRFDTEQTMWRCTSSHSSMGCQVWESITSSGSDLHEITGTITTNATSTYTYRLYQYEFIFDKTYVGSITFNGNHPGATTTTTYYVNGNRLVLTDINLVTSFTIGSYNLTYAPLETISQLRQWNIPFESYNAVFYSMKEYDPIDYFSYENISYPIYSVNANSTIMNGHIASTLNRENICIMYINKNIYDINTLQQNLNIIPSLSGSTISISNFTQMGLTRTSTDTFCLIKFQINCNANTWFNINALTDIKYIPIYLNYVSYQPSTDFALIYKLSNQLLDDLHIIAQGTQQSDSIASGLDSNTNQMQSDFNSYYSIENSANSDFNSALNGINFNDQIAGNQSFLDSASFVKTVFSSMMQIPILSTFVIILCIVLMARIFL